MIRFEHERQPLASRKRFAIRLIKAWFLGTLVVLVSLGIGMVGYWATEEMSWLDAFANASMIVSGMGPLVPVQTDAGKFFAGCYALYSGFVVLISAAIIFAPVLHRGMHRFHIDESKHE